MPDRPQEPPVWSAPLVPVAVALTAGIVADRFLILPVAASIGFSFASLILWFALASSPRKALAVPCLWLIVAGLGATWHHARYHHVDANDLSRVADREGQPARLRGTLHTAPAFQAGKADPLRTLPTKDSTRFVLQVTHRQDLSSRAWRDVNGLVQVHVSGRVRDVTVGDEVELLGRLALPGEPMNPGELDYASFLRDQGITTTLTKVDPEEVKLTRRGWPTSPFGWLATIRGWGQYVMAKYLSTQHEVAAALLLGEGSGMTGEAWEKYMHTGVLHALAISGQHLIVLAGFLWFGVRILGIRRRSAACVIAVFLIAYALLAGGRPPVMRAAIVIAAYSGGMWFQRPVWHANVFALAWIGVLALNPTDVFNAGCQLSFLAVSVLMWGAGHWSETSTDPLAMLIDTSRPWYEQLARSIVRWIVAAYVLNAAVWLAVSPLVAAHYHTVSPIALLIGPPVVLLTSIALLAGFGLLLFTWLPPVAILFGWITQWSLLGCETIVSHSQRLPGAYTFVADVPGWWLAIFYVGLIVAMTMPIVWRHAKWALVSGGAWFALGVALQLMPHRPGELRCTFVAVGHGGCTVIETPNGRVIVYDAGATAGPDVTRRHIAPFLWSRGIRRIDELILSHADLDHFNGVPQLADRFTIGRVVTTPSFAERSIAAVQKTLDAIDARGIPLDVVHAGRQWEHDGVSFEVLHPPPAGPAGKENARSLVVHVKHVGWSMLLTGDLEDAGLAQVLASPLRPVDVLMAPHHGSDRSNVPALAERTRPKLVVSSQAEPTSERVSVKMYEQLGATYLSTWPHGAITLRPQSEVPVETYRTKLSLRPFR